MTDQLTIPSTSDQAPTSEPGQVTIPSQPEPAAAAIDVHSSTPVQETLTPSLAQPEIEAAVEPLEAKEEKKRKTRKPKADDKAEAITELEAQLEELKSSQEKSVKRMSKHEDSMREALLDKLGVQAKFRQYAPKVDPFSEKGRAELESWATENPELRDARPVPTPDFDVSSQVKSFKSPHLVSTEHWKDSIKASKSRGGER